MLRILAVSILISVLSIQNTKAGHLIGGELTYECIGNELYVVQLKVFRDCACQGCAFFDNPAYVFVYDDFGTIVDVLEMTYPGPVPLPYDPKVNPCLELPPDLCVEEAVYTQTVYLIPYGGGYDLVYQRCCRNESILNLDLANTPGATFYAHVPEPALGACNSDPYFTNFPPIALCVNDTFVFDHSATEIDGDSLYYELCTPYDGASSTIPQPDAGTAPPPPPYTLVTYASPYSFNAPLMGSPQMTIDAITGMLICRPNTMGQFVVGVCVSEYRNGILLSTTKRDFQFNVVECNAPVTAALPSYVMNCDDTVNFVNNSIGGTFYQWDFGDGNTDTTESPIHAYLDTGLYNVSLIINEGWPCSDTAYTTVNIYPDLVADFSYEIHCADSDITFTDLSSTTLGSITDWSWSFGEGGNDTALNPVYNYSQGGVYSVQLLIINDTGCYDVNVKEIYVYEEPPVAIYFDTKCVDSLITFSDDTQLDSGSVVSWDWDIGGFVTGTNSTITYTFDSITQYLLTLSVVTNHGCEGIATKAIVIEGCDPPTGLDNLNGQQNAPFSVTPNPSNGLFNINILNGSQGEDLLFEVYEITGRKVLQMTGFELFDGDPTIDLHQYGSGVYFLKITDGKEAYSLKLVVD